MTLEIALVLLLILCNGFFAISACSFSMSPLAIPSEIFFVMPMTTLKEHNCIVNIEYAVA